MFQIPPLTLRQGGNDYKEGLIVISVSLNYHLVFSDTLVTRENIERMNCRQHI